jgi:hypothetical protein
LSAEANNNLREEEAMSIQQIATYILLLLPLLIIGTSILVISVVILGKVAKGLFKGFVLTGMALKAFFSNLKGNVS